MPTFLRKQRGYEPLDNLKYVKLFFLYNIGKEMAST